MTVIAQQSCIQGMPAPVQWPDAIIPWERNSVFGDVPAEIRPATGWTVRGTGGISALSAQTAARPEPLCPVPWTKLPNPGRGVCPGLGCASLGSGLEPPAPPSLDADPRPRIPPKSGPPGPEFLRFFGACGATSRGGGGAPPTTLILLRNQRAAVRSRAATPPPPSRGRSGAAGAGPPAQLGQTRPKNRKFFFFS